MKLIAEDDLLSIAKDVTLANGAKHRCIDATQIHELSKTEIIPCKDCAHRPKKPDDYDPTEADSGFTLEFPDYVCPARVPGDDYYSWYPGDYFFCGFGKRKET